MKYKVVVFDDVYVLLHFNIVLNTRGEGGSTVVKVLCYKPEGRWFDPR